MCWKKYSQQGSNTRIFRAGARARTQRRHLEYPIVANASRMLLSNFGSKSGSVGWSKTWTNVPGRMHLVKKGFGMIACVSLSISPVKNQTKISAKTTPSTHHSRYLPKCRINKAEGPEGMHTAISTGGSPNKGNKSNICLRAWLIWSVMKAKLYFVCSGCLQFTSSLPTIWDNDTEKDPDKCQEAHNLSNSNMRQFVTVIRQARLNLVRGDMRYSLEDRRACRDFKYRCEKLLLSDRRESSISRLILAILSYKSDVALKESCLKCK